MKVAICFRGFMRHWKRTYPNWKRLFDKYNADVFIHTWDTDDRKDTSNVVLSDQSSGTVTGPPLDMDMVKQLYNPKVIVAETYSQFHDRFVKESEWLSTTREMYAKQHPDHYWIYYTRFVPMLSMFYKWMQTSAIKQQYEIENNFVYDIVLHSRTDFLIDEDFMLEKTNEIVTGPWPSTEHTQHWVDYSKGLNDFWMYGPSKKMDIFANLYPRLEEVWKFCMETEGYGFFEASNLHTLPITNLKLRGINTFIKTSNQHGYVVT